MKESPLIFEGTVVEILKGNNFKVKTEKFICNCKPSGKIRTHKIMIVVGDKVKIETSPYDLTKGRIIFRERV